MIDSTAPPRGRFVRIVLAGLLGFVLIMLSVGPRVFVEEVSGHEYLGRLVGGMLPFLVGAWLAPKVAYRRRDALIFLTMGLWVVPSVPLFLKVIWRTAHLPHRDWSLRAVAEPSARPIPAATRPLPAWARDVTSR